MILDYNSLMSKIPLNPPLIKGGDFEMVMFHG